MDKWLNESGIGRLCPQCKHSNPERARFCAQCGRRVSPDSFLLPPDESDVDRFCIRCGQSAPNSPARRAAPVPARKVRPLFVWLLGIVAVVWVGVMLSWYYFSRENPLHMEFSIIPRGCFQMGSQVAAREEPVHEVCLDWFHLGKYEVTQKQWQTIMGSNPSAHQACGENCPVTSVSWEMVQEFIDKLNAVGFGKYRLPTEAEWEYACRGGARQLFCGGDNADQLAWYRGNSQQTLHPVGRKVANAFGLHDMNGNVWEWVVDRFDEKYYASAPRNNPKGPSSGTMRIFRGGSGNSSEDYLRPTLRNLYDPRILFEDVGFRLVKEP